MFGTYPGHLLKTFCSVLALSLGWSGVFCRNKLWYVLVVLIVLIVLIVLVIFHIKVFSIREVVLGRHWSKKVSQYVHKTGEQDTH